MSGPDRKAALRHLSVLNALVQRRQFASRKAEPLSSRHNSATLKSKRPSSKRDEEDSEISEIYALLQDLLDQASRTDREMSKEEPEEKSFWDSLLSTVGSVASSFLPELVAML